MATYQAQGLDPEDVAQAQVAHFAEHGEMPLPPEAIPQRGRQEGPPLVSELLGGAGSAATVLDPTGLASPLGSWMQGVDPGGGMGNYGTALSWMGYANSLSTMTDTTADSTDRLLAQVDLSMGVLADASTNVPYVGPVVNALNAGWQTGRWIGERSGLNDWADEQGNPYEGVDAARMQAIERGAAAGDPQLQELLASHRQMTDYEDLGAQVAPEILEMDLDQGEIQERLREAGRQAAVDREVEREMAEMGDLGDSESLRNVAVMLAEENNPSVGRLQGRIEEGEATYDQRLADYHETMQPVYDRAALENAEDLLEMYGQSGRDVIEERRDEGDIEGALELGLDEDARMAAGRQRLMRQAVDAIAAERGIAEDDVEGRYAIFQEVRAQLPTSETLQDRASDLRGRLD